MSKLKKMNFEPEDAELAWINFEWSQNMGEAHVIPRAPCNTPMSENEDASAQ